jgi:chemotaxis protein MotC
VAGHVALVQAELVAKSDPKKAVALLDDARLLSPGTLIEEAALRREAALIAAQGNINAFQSLAAHYLRRFANSVYAGSFRQQVATIIAGVDFAKQPEALSQFATAFEGLSGPDRRDLSLLVAREGLLKGNLALVRLATSNAERLAERESLEDLRTQLYAAAANVVVPQQGNALARLERVDRTRLSQEEAELMDAVSSVAAAVTSLPAEPYGTAPQQVVDEVGSLFNASSRAREAIVRIDRMLGVSSQ